MDRQREQTCVGGRLQLGASVSSGGGGVSAHSHQEGAPLVQADRTTPNFSTRVRVKARVRVRVSLTHLRM